MNNFYVYKHIRLDNNQVFYVGKGKLKRAYTKFGRSNHWKRIVKKVGYKIEFIAENLTEKNSFDIEKFFILYYGRLDLGLGNLINKTDGGEGSSGFKHSKESLIVMSDIKKGKQLSNEHKIKISLSCNNPSKKIREKMSLSHLGKTHLSETREKISKSHLGKKHLNVTKEKISNGRIGKYLGKDNPNATPVVNQFGDIFSTTKEASDWCGLYNGSHITSCCKFIKKSAGKHPITGEKLIWRYFDYLDNPIQIGG